MGSLADLNTYSEEPIAFTDNRPANVFFTVPIPEDQPTVTATTNTISISRPYEIIEIVRPEVTQITYSIDVSDVEGAVVNWATIPSGSNVTEVNGVYTINGIDTIAEWDQVKDPTITIPNTFNGIFSYTVSINYQTSAGPRTYSWQVEVNLLLAQLQSKFTLSIQIDLSANLTSTFNLSANVDAITVLIDPNAQYLELAIPFNQQYGFNDVSHLYINNPKTQPIVNNVSSPSGVTIDSTFSKFYGSSYYATTGSGAKANYTLSQQFNTSTNFTMEFWCRPTKTEAAPDGQVNSWILSNNDFGTRWLIGIHAGTFLANPNFFGGTNSLTPLSIKGLDSSVGYNLGDWVHIAIQNDGWWYRGSWMGTAAMTNRTFNILHLGQQNNDDPNDFLGNIQDFKLYVGIKKYTNGNNIPSSELTTNILDFTG